MTTASVARAAYISSLLRNGRGWVPITRAISATPSSRRRLQMSDTATISKFSSLPSWPYAGRCACRNRSEKPTMPTRTRSEEHTSELQSPYDLVCRLLLEKKKKTTLKYFILKNNKKKKKQI